MAKNPLKTGISANADSYQRAAKGPYTSMWHDHIMFNGEATIRLDGVLDIKTIEACMNMAYQAGLNARKEK